MEAIEQTCSIIASELVKVKMVNWCSNSSGKAGLTFKPRIDEGLRVGS